VATAFVSSLTQEEELNWLALKMVPGLGARTAARLLERFRTPKAILAASRSEIEASGIAGGVAQSIASGCAFEDAVLQQQKMRESGADLVVLSDPRYPQRLREIFDPPFALFARGRIELLASLVLGVVGTRRPTPYGLAVAERLGGDLARAGLTIASGMARGIDTAAHRGALAAAGNTVAVLGCGVDLVYPSENRKLAAEIVERGLVISEFPMGAPAYPQNFPIRNRIISGLSAGVLVVEGAQYSGSSITARLALEQGREVFAVPGSIVSKMSWGPNLLIKQGAKLVQDWNDVVVELAPDDRRALAARACERLFAQGEGETEAAGNASTLPLPDNPVVRKILGQIKIETPTHIDDLIGQIEEVSSSEIVAALFELEMLGAIRQLPGKNFVKVW
jgi:DNA processing protein